jgi:hypothetical protein
VLKSAVDVAGSLATFLNRGPGASEKPLKPPGEISTKFGTYWESMSRTPVGTRPQAESDTALFAHVAYRLEGKTTAEIATYANDVLQIKAGENAIRKAPATCARLCGLTAPEQAVRPWLRVDTDALDLFTAVVRVRSTHAGTYAGMDRIAGVVQIFRLEGEGDLFAIVVYERRSDQTRLRARMEELGEIVSWEVVAHQTQWPTIATWRALTQQAAQREGLLAEQRG